MSENKSKSSSTNTNTSANTNTNTNINTDTLDFVKNLWGGMQIPGFSQASGMNIPTVSVQDLDKKIEDLRTVESWLQVNMNMLRGTIQTLEVQRATIAALQSMSVTLAGATEQSASKQATAKDQSDAQLQFAQPAAWWNLLQDQFKSVLSAVVPDAGENHAEKAAAPKPESAKKSVKTPAKTATKTVTKTPTRRSTSKKAVE